MKYIYFMSYSVRSFVGNRTLSLDFKIMRTEDLRKTEKILAKMISDSSEQFDADEVRILSLHPLMAQQG